MVVHADDKLTAFLKLKSEIRSQLALRRRSSRGNALAWLRIKILCRLEGAKVARSRSSHQKKGASKEGSAVSRGALMLGVKFLCFLYYGVIGRK